MSERNRGQKRAQSGSNLTHNMGRKTKFANNPIQKTSIPAVETPDAQRITTWSDFSFNCEKWNRVISFWVSKQASPSLAPAPTPIDVPTAPACATLPAPTCNVLLRAFPFASLRLCVTSLFFSSRALRLCVPSPIFSSLPPIAGPRRTMIGRNSHTLRPVCLHPSAWPRPASAHGAPIRLLQWLGQMPYRSQ